MTRAWLKSSARSLVALDRGKVSDVFHRMSWKGRLTFCAVYGIVLGCLECTLWVAHMTSKYDVEASAVFSACLYFVIVGSWLDVAQRIDDGRLALEEPPNFGA